MIFQRVAEYALIKLVDYLIDRYLKHGDEEKAESLKQAKATVKNDPSHDPNAGIA